MLRRALQALVRLWPKPARTAWDALPPSLRDRFGPLVHPIAAGSRRGNLELSVEAPLQSSRYAVVAPTETPAGLLRAAERAGHDVYPVSEAADVDRLAAERKLFDAVLAGGGVRLAERGRAWGFRVASGKQASLEALDASFPRVTIVVPTWQNRRLCGYCLASIARNTAWPSFDVVVVDNGSSDGTAELVQSFAARDSRFTCLVNRRNVGFARAVNQGIRRSTAPYVVILNDDVVVGPGWLSRLIAHLEREPELALVGAVTNQIGNRAKVPAGYDSLESMEHLARTRAIEHAGELLTLPVVALFCAALRRTALDSVGLLDERYELGMFEDDDLSQALTKHGFRIGIAGDAFVHHVGQATLGRLSDAEYLRVWEANKRRFEQKWRTRWTPPPVR